MSSCIGVLTRFVSVAVELWAALSTDGLLSAALWALVAFYVLTVLVALAIFSNKGSSQ